MPFNVASLKDKATHVKNASITKFQDARDKYSSQPLAKSKFSDSGYAPQPASSTPHSSGSSLSRPLPPPISRTTKPSSNQRQPASAKIDWTNLSLEDKEEFFRWLDEFFERFLGVPVEKNESALDTHNEEPHGHGRTATGTNTHLTPTSSLTLKSPIPTRGPPPRPNLSTKPTSPSPSPVAHSSSGLEMSYPPATVSGCAALDLAQYLRPHTQWDKAWYSSEIPLPPSLEGSSEVQTKMMYVSHMNTKTVFVGAIFSDLSFCWASVAFPLSAPSDPSRTERHAEYIPPPGPLSQEELVEAHETYGDTIAAFAESFLGSGQFCARGECWDLANEALKYVSSFDYVPKPVPSVGRTHGHLIFQGKANGKGNQVGRWRGGDDRVRRGDIVEWRSVRINFVGAPRGSYAMLGDPDHTAVIIKDAVPRRTPRDGETLLPSDLVQLHVVEQSTNQPPEPKERTYDLTAFEQGEVWIYRPIGMRMYLGLSELEPKAPSDVPTQQL